MNALTCICSLSMAIARLGCSGGETKTPTPSDDAGSIARCETPFLGDATMAPEIELVSLKPGGVLAPIIEGGSVSLLESPIAVRVIVASARVRNMDPCAIRLAGLLRGPVSEVVLIDNRIVNFEPMNDGWGGLAPTDLYPFSNSDVCPQMNMWSMQDVFGKEYELTIAVTDRDGRKVTQTVHVVPTCNEPGKEAGCMCVCKQGYQLGQPCSSSGDGGP